MKEGEKENVRENKDCVCVHDRLSTGTSWLGLYFEAGDTLGEVVGNHRSCHFGSMAPWGLVATYFGNLVQSQDALEDKEQAD